MARITCDDCLEHVANRYELVHTASDRVRQLTQGFKEPMIDVDIVDERGGRKDKETVIALREIAAGVITPEIIKATSFREEPDEVGLDLDSITEKFNEVDRQIEEANRLAEEKAKEES